MTHVDRAHEPAAAGPLTSLTPDERLFQEAVAAFAKAEVLPRVGTMEKEAHLEEALIQSAFELGLMGIEVDEQYGGAGGSLMMVTLAVEAISRVDASVAILVDVRNTLVNYPIARYGDDAQKSHYLTRLTRDTVGAYALSEPGSAPTRSAWRHAPNVAATAGSLPVARCGSPTARKPGST